MRRASGPIPRHQPPVKASRARACRALIVGWWNAGPIRVLAEQADPTFQASVDRHGNARPVHRITDGRTKGNNAF